MPPCASRWPSASAARIGRRSPAASAPLPALEWSIDNDRTAGRHQAVSTRLGAARGRLARRGYEPGARRTGRHPRRVGIGQVHPAQHPRVPGGSDHGQLPARRPGRSRRRRSPPVAAAGARHRVRLPGLPPAAAHHGAGKRRDAGALLAGGAQPRRHPPPRLRRAGAGGVGPSSAPLPARTLRRRTAACRRGAGGDQRSRADPGGRAHRQPRCRQWSGGDAPAARAACRRPHRGAGHPRRGCGGAGAAAGDAAGRTHRRRSGRGGRMRLWIWLNLGLRSLNRNRRRSLAMMAGIAAGIALLTTVNAVGAASRRLTLAQVKNMLGTFDTVLVRPGAAKTRGMVSLANVPPTLTFDDAAALAQLPAITQVAELQNAFDIDVEYRDRQVTPAVFGVSANWLDLRGDALAGGRFFTPAEMQSENRVAVVGADVVAGLFAGTNPLGATVRLGGGAYQVVGVLAPRGAGPGGFSLDNLILIPLSTARHRLFNR